MATVFKQQPLQKMLRQDGVSGNSSSNIGPMITEKTRKVSLIKPSIREGIEKDVQDAQKTGAEIIRANADRRAGTILSMVGVGLTAVTALEMVAILTKNSASLFFPVSKVLQDQKVTQAVLKGDMSLGVIGVVLTMVGSYLSASASRTLQRINKKMKNESEEYTKKRIRQPVQKGGLLISAAERRIEERHRDRVFNALVREGEAERNKPSTIRQRGINNTILGSIVLATGASISTMNLIYHNSFYQAFSFIRPGSEHPSRLLTTILPAIYLTIVEAALFTYGSLVIRRGIRQIRRSKVDHGRQE